MTIPTTTTTRPTDPPGAAASTGDGRTDRLPNGPKALDIRVRRARADFHF